VELWAEKEYRNLSRAFSAGVPCPKPLLQKQNILFMKFLGNGGWACPQLREVTMNSSKKWTHLYCQTMVAIRRLYHYARLVHADLSEYNILLCPSSMLLGNRDFNNNNNNNKQLLKGEEGSSDEELQIALIDFGQAVHVNHPSAATYLERDLSRLSFFFSGCGAQVLNLEESRKFVLSPCEYASSIEESIYDDYDNDDIVQNHTDTEVSTSPSLPPAEKINENNGHDNEEDGYTNKRISPLTRIWDDESEYQKLQNLLENLI
jgi:serine/threonine-protein kinase RIO1